MPKVIQDEWIMLATHFWKTQSESSYYWLNIVPSSYKSILLKDHLSMTYGWHTSPKPTASEKRINLTNETEKMQLGFTLLGVTTRWKLQF